jgi:NAD(P)-dependent dehydrogenase (short-subunit alcohol dehydrogenase family)
MIPISKRVALVTGGASGLGRAVTEAILARGGRVVVADTASPASQLLQDGASIFSETDVTKPKDVRRAMQSADAAFGAGVNMVVHCAGILSILKVLPKVPEDDEVALSAFRHGLEVNTVGTFNVLRIAAEHMAKNSSITPSVDERGLFVQTSSIAASEGQIGQAAYSASKAAVIGMMLPCARELARHGIRINTIAPGVFGTDMVLKGLQQAAQDRLEKQMVFPGRLGRPEEFAHMVCAIAENPYINGEVTRLDGATRMV